MLYLIETAMFFTFAFCLLLGIILLIPAAIIALFKIDEADHYFGIGRLGGERLIFKGLPFSLGRMAHYGTVMLLSNTSYMKKRYSQELKQIAASSPPKRLTRLLVWLYGTWYLLSMVTLVLTGVILVTR